MESDEYARLIVRTAVRALGPTIENVVTPAGISERSWVIHVFHAGGSRGGSRDSLGLMIPWGASDADPEKLEAFVKGAVRRWLANSRIESSD